MRNSGVSMEDLAAKRGDGAPEDDAFSELLARKDLSEDSKVALFRVSQNRAAYNQKRPRGHSECSHSRLRSSPSVRCGSQANVVCGEFGRFPPFTLPIP